MVKVLAGISFTVTVVVWVVVPMPFVTAYEIVALPAATPLTKPVLETVAIFVFEELQTQFCVLLDNCVVAFLHTVFVPVILATTGNVADPCALTNNAQLKNSNKQ